jgi:AraC-like DNA-binding protein
MPGGSTVLMGNDPHGATTHVAAWVCAPVERARLIDALRARAGLYFVNSADELLVLLRGSIRPIDVVILPSVDASGRGTEQVVRQVAVDRPRAAIIVWCPSRRGQAIDLRSLTAAGAHQFLMAGDDESGAVIRGLLERARHTQAAEHVTRQMGEILGTPLQPIVEAIVENPHVTSVRELADVMGVNRKTLFNRCSRAGSVNPAELLVWSRLALVAYYLENTGCTVETLAVELNYPSSSTLRNTIKRYTTLRARDLRAQGALDALLAALRARLRRLSVRLE